jgi:hypothetical protein
MEFEGADAHEGGIYCESFVCGIEDGYEFGELGGGGRDSEGSSNNFRLTKEGQAVSNCKDRGNAYIMAFRTSPIGIIPSFSSLSALENSPNASLISLSSAAVMLCSFASLDWRVLGVAASAAGARRLAGWVHVRYNS